MRGAGALERAPATSAALVLLRCSWLQGSRLMRCLCAGMTSLLAQLFAALLVGQVPAQFDGGGLHLVVGVELVQEDDVELTA